jgi:hypothetical protein
MSKELTKLKDIENVIENYETFTAFVIDQDTHVENATIELIGILYGLDNADGDDPDIDELSPDYFINIIESTLDLHRAYMRRNQQ